MIRARIIAAGFAGVLIVVAIWWIYHRGSTTGAAKATRQIEQQHADRVAEARADERAAAVVSNSISQRVARADDLSTRAVKATIKDLRDAIDTVPPAAAGAPAPAAPVERLRDALNADIDRANRAAGAAGPVG
ncbi:hypothetical protein [Sphingomonas melonis]|uniref:Uncharacterized protein n=1 Tax=Sphingomonas melonis TaxID=152682 RepID=A0A7Y9K4J4_9SPHN|nr:hypothetical protein [Sphingomonas melonis]NYD91445.1 hypothetical protein [Sphingomonas melonis]